MIIQSRTDIQLMIAGIRRISGNLFIFIFIFHIGYFYYMCNLTLWVLSLHLYS